MNIDVVNVPKQDEYEKFKQLCPDAREITYEDGSKSLVVEKNGVELFKLDFIKKGQLSERDIFVVKNWGLNPNNVEQIVEAYNAFMTDKIDLSKKTEEEKNYYKVSGGGLDYAKGLISEIKRLNPNVQIDGQWIDRNYRHEQITIISSIPLEQLNMPTGYYGNALGRTIFSETQEEYSQNLSGDFLNFNVSQAHAREFTNDLRKFNPNVSISIEFNEEKKIGKINSSIPLDKLNYPTGYYGGIGLDKDGYVAYLKDRVIDYKIGYELDAMDSSKQYTENIQRYFSSVSYYKMQEMKNEKKTPVVEATQTKKQDSDIQIQQPTKQKLEEQQKNNKIEEDYRKNTFKQVKNMYKKANGRSFERFMNFISGRSPKWKKISKFSQEKLDYLIKTYQGETKIRQDSLSHIRKLNLSFAEERKRVNASNWVDFTNLLRKEELLKQSMEIENKKGNHR